MARLLSAARTTLAPQAPTFREQGIDIELASLSGLAAPNGLPEPVKKKLVDAMAAVAADAQFQQQRDMAPPAYAAELERTEAGFRRLWAEMPWQDNKP